MRVAPIGIFAATRGEEAARAQIWPFDSATTPPVLPTGTPQGTFPPGPSLCLSPTFTRPSLQKAVRRAIGELAQEPGSNETIEKLETALRLSQRNKDPVSCIEELGQGWTGEEALAIAVFCALRADSLEDGITLAVNITGDSDSTGALAGNLLGALYGYNVIPQRWLEKLELREVIETVARDLLGIHDATLSAVESCPAHPSRREQLEYYLALKEQEWWLARYPG